MPKTLTHSIKRCKKMLSTEKTDLPKITDMRNIPIKDDDDKTLLDHWFKTAAWVIVFQNAFFAAIAINFGFENGYSHIAHFTSMLIFCMSAALLVFSNILIKRFNL